MINTPRFLTFIFLLNLIYFNSIAQDEKVYRLNQASHFCTASISLLKGGQFIYERGCEGSSFTCFGKWFKTGNTIRLEPADNKNFVIIRYFEAGPPKDGHSGMKVIDIAGKDMSQKMKYTMLDTLHKELGPARNWEEAAQKAKFIRMTTIKNIFETAIDVDNTKPMSNIMQLNIPEKYIYNANSVWELPPVLEYLLDENCLLEKKPGQTGSQRYCPL